VTPWQTEGLLYQPWRMQRAAEDSLMRPVGQEVWAALCWAEGQLIASEMDFVDSVQLRRAPVETIQEAASQPQHSWGWAAAAGLALLAAAGALALLKRRQDAAKALSRRRLRQGLKELRDLGKDDAFIEAIDRLEAEWLDQGTAATLQKVHPELELTSIEEEVLHLLASGRSSKDIARTMDLSVSYVYNIRGRLRKKLDVPDGVDFDDWISKKFGVE
jgi:LPXTG-motif cell wall-anchored protein